MRTPLDLIIAALLLAGAVTLAQVARRVAAARPLCLTREEPEIWYTLAVVLAMFAAIKCVNAFFMIQDVFRDLLQEQGLYAGRRTAQLAMVSLVCFALVAAAGAVQGRARTLKNNTALVLCVTALGALGAIRLISLHTVDAVLTPIPGSRLVIEAGLTTTIAYLAWRKRGDLEERLGDEARESKLKVASEGRTV